MEERSFNSLRITNEGRVFIDDVELHCIVSVSVTQKPGMSGFSRATFTMDFPEYSFDVDTSTSWRTFGNDETVEAVLDALERKTLSSKIRKKLRGEALN